MCACQIDWSAIAAWVQGIGSLLALAVAVGIYRKQKTDAKTTASNDKVAVRAAATALLIPKLFRLKLQLGLWEVMMVAPNSDTIEFTNSKAPVAKELELLIQDSSTWIHFDARVIHALTFLLAKGSMLVNVIETLKDRPGGPAEHAKVIGALKELLNTLLDSVASLARSIEVAISPSEFGKFKALLESLKDREFMKEHLDKMASTEQGSSN